MAVLDTRERPDSGLWARIDQNGTITYIVVATVAGALFPRLAYLVRWPTRLGVKGRLLLTAWNATWYYVVRFLIVPRFRARAAEWELARTVLREQLGREPTHEEIAQRVWPEPRS